MKKVGTSRNGLELLTRCAGCQRRTLVNAILSSWALLMLAGCGENRVSVYTVAGKVSFEGKPPAGAQVVFHPVGHTLPEGEIALGAVKEDGSFDVNIYGKGGVPAGSYIATFQWNKLVETEGGSGRGPNVLPKKYADAASSPLKVTIKAEENVLDPIVIE